MNISDSLRQTVLLTALMAGSSMVMAADNRAESGGLRPANSETALRQVPGAVRKSVSRDSSVRLVQHAPAAQKQATDGSGRKTEREKKPGLFKRLFGRLSSDRDQSEQFEKPVVTGRAPHVPAPPPIQYRTNAGQAGRKGIPAQTISLHRNSAQPLIQNQNAPAEQPSMSPPPVPAPPQDGFVDPFGGEEITEREDVLLDLDSLIEDAAPVRDVGAQNATVSSDSAQTEVLPELPNPADMEAAAIEAAETEQAGPFTGVRLESDEDVFAPAAEPVDSPAADFAELEAAQAEAESETETEAPVVREDILIDLDTLTAESSAPQTEDSPEMAETAEGIEAEETSDATDSDVTQLPPVEEDAQNAAAATENATTEVPATEVDVAAADVAPATIDEEPATAPAAESLPPGSPRLKALDSRARREQQRFLIMARAGRTGFKGFCPVQLRDHRELIDSREEHSAKFGLVTYHFSSPEARTAFEADPSRYAPAAGGSDVVLLINAAEEVSGSLDFSLWYRDRLYMFRSRETQNIFARDPSRYADQY